MVVDVMVDLETMSTRGDAAFVSIGAVAFDPDGSSVPKDGKKVFHRNVDLQSCIDLGLRVSGDTVMWWLSRPDVARQSLMDPPPVPVTDVLTAFTEWYSSVTRYGSCVWSHGATFDVPLISECYERLGLKAPWKFWDVNDTRTVFRRVGMKLPRADDRADGHTALFDAITQAEHLQKCHAAMRAMAVPVDPASLETVEI